MPPALESLLLERAAGNPFYLEALVRMLIDDGVIDATQTPWRLRGRWHEHARVPPTLVGVLQARLDALPADELVALQEASIVGPVFWDSALATIDAHAPGRLPALTARHLVVERGGSTFAQAAELAFHHQLLHDVTYDTVLAPARRQGHARVARWLADRVADRAGEFLGITAEHFERAGDSAQALDYYDRALQLLGLADIHGDTRVPLYVLNVTYPLVDAQFTRFCAGKRAVLMVEEGQPDFLEQNLHTGEAMPLDSRPLPSRFCPR